MLVHLQKLDKIGAIAEALLEVILIALENKMDLDGGALCQSLYVLELMALVHSMVVKME